MSLNLSDWFMVVGAVKIAYTAIAYVVGLPQISDFLPVDLFFSGSGLYYKVVQSDVVSYADCYTVVIGVVFVLIGLFMRSKHL